MARRKKNTDIEEDPFDFIEEVVDEQAASPPRPGWPVSMPLLVADDLCWNFSQQGGRMDLLEWLSATFEVSLKKPRSGKRRDKAERVLCEVIRERLDVKKVSQLWLFLEHTFKHRRPSLAWQAAAWNEAMRRLGYDVPAKKCKEPK